MESLSEWSGTIVMAKKHNEVYRLWLDFRKLNVISKSGTYPLSFMSHILRKLCAARFISNIDLSSALNRSPTFAKLF